MALTDSEKGEIVFYLGYPATTLVTGTTYYSTIISDRLDALPDYAETRVKKLLKKIRDLDVKLEEATERMSVQEVDGFKLNQNEVKSLKGMRKTYIKEISTMTGVPSGCTSGISIIM